MSTDRYHEERLAQLISMLPPPPTGWAEAAAALPSARAGLDKIVARAEADAAFRAALIADLETTLAQEGVEPSRSVVNALRRLLAE